MAKKSPKSTTPVVEHPVVEPAEPLAMDPMESDHMDGRHDEMFVQECPLCVRRRDEDLAAEAERLAVERESAGTDADEPQLTVAMDVMPVDEDRTPPALVEAHQAMTEARSAYYGERTREHAATYAEAVTWLAREGVAAGGTLAIAADLLTSTVLPLVKKHELPVPADAQQLLDDAQDAAVAMGQAPAEAPAELRAQAKSARLRKGKTAEDTATIEGRIREDGTLTVDKPRTKRADKVEAPAKAEESAELEPVYAVDLAPDGPRVTHAMEQLEDGRAVWVEAASGWLFFRDFGRADVGQLARERMAKLYRVQVKALVHPTSKRTRLLATSNPIPEATK